MSDNLAVAPAPAGANDLAVLDADVLLNQAGAFPAHAATAPSVLVVDDDEGVAALLSRILAAEGYRVRHAPDGRAAFARLAEALPDLVLLDLDMPQLGGFEVCRRVKSDPATRLLPVVILTGRDPDDARLRAWDLGADDFIAKPFAAAELLARCRGLLRAKRLVDELDSAQAVVFAFARAIEAKCPHTLGHTERVTARALALAARADLPEVDREALRLGAMLHDIGKIGVPDAVLNKPGPLTAGEYATVKRHPADGCRIAEPLRSLQGALPFIRWHHERPDGKGYPDGLVGAAIPLPVRVLSVADVFDALASARPYRAALPWDECLDTMRSSARDGGLDPNLVECFAEGLIEGALD
jgi:putative two-component system response regulator